MVSRRVGRPWPAGANLRTVVRTSSPALAGRGVVRNHTVSLQAMKITELAELYSNALCESGLIFPIARIVACTVPRCVASIWELKVECCSHIESCCATISEACDDTGWHSLFSMKIKIGYSSSPKSHLDKRLLVFWPLFAPAGADKLAARKCGEAGRKSLTRGVLPRTAQ